MPEGQVIKAQVLWTFAPNRAAGEAMGNSHNGLHYRPARKQGLQWPTLCPHPCRRRQAHKDGPLRAGKGQDVRRRASRGVPPRGGSTPRGA